MAFPSGVIACVLKLLMNSGNLELLATEDAVMHNSAAWSGFNVVVGFLVIFRTSQSYSRYVDGLKAVFRMRTEWFDACAALLAFCKFSKASDEAIWTFQHTVIRLFSMLHALALGEIEDCNSEDVDDVAAFKFEIIDAEGIDFESLSNVRYCDTKVELVFQWIQQLIVENIETGVMTIPGPLLTRVFQEIANGMVAVNDAIRISSVPFPFPYAQSGDLTLLVHWVMCPIVTAQWTSSAFWAFVFTFIQVFFFWSLNWIAVEIENPFGEDANDMDAESLQSEMNQHLLLLIKGSTRRTPRLSANKHVGNPADLGNVIYHNSKSLFQIWLNSTDGDKAQLRKGMARAHDSMENPERDVEEGIDGEPNRRGGASGFLVDLDDLARNSSPDVRVLKLPSRASRGKSFLGSGGRVSSRQSRTSQAVKLGCVRSSRSPKAQKNKGRNVDKIIEEIMRQQHENSMKAVPTTDSSMMPTVKSKHSSVGSNAGQSTHASLSHNAVLPMTPMIKPPEDREHSILQTDHEDHEPLGFEVLDSSSPWHSPPGRPPELPGVPGVISNDARWASAC